MEATKKIKKRKAELLAICQNIESAARNDDSLSGIVSFLEHTQKLEGRRIVNLIKEFREKNTRGQYDGLIENLVNLQVHIIQTSFSKYGINRTPAGLKPSEHTVYLGINGTISPQTVHFWRNHNGHQVDVQKIVSQQAKTFIDAHARPIKEAINLLVNAY